jgi:hypothetical protein
LRADCDAADMRTAANIEQHNSLKATKKRGRGPDKHPRTVHDNSRANLTPYPKGVSGNPGGLPGYDVAAAIARRVFELNEAAIYEGMAEEVISGKPYAFDVIANRAYGKTKERVEITGADGAPLAIKVEFASPSTDGK